MCNRLPKTCNRLPVKKFEKSFLKKYISSNHFEKDTMGLYIIVSDFEKQEKNILRELNRQMLSQQLLVKHLQIY